jgi:hypothetical protein
VINWVFFDIVIRPCPTKEEAGLSGTKHSKRSSNQEQQHGIGPGNNEMAAGILMFPLGAFE